jgi:preprotein translocase subunit SecG
MIYAVTALHVLVCLFLIIVVLLQSGKAADLAGAFGGMGSQTVFGPRGAATVLSKATTVAAVLFMFTSLALAVLNSKQGPSSGSVLEKYGRKPAATQQKKTTPVAPAPATPAPAAPSSPAPANKPGPQPAK